MDLEQALAAIAKLEDEKERLIAKRDELLTETQRKSERLKALKKYEDIDVEALIKFKEDKEREQLESEGKYAEAIEKERKRLEKREEEFKRQLQEREELLTKEKEQLAKEKEEGDRRLLTLQLDNRVIDEYARAGVIAPKQLLSLTKSQLKLNESQEPVVVDGYREIPVKEYIETLKKNEEYAHHFRATGGRGTGAPPTGTSTGSTPSGNNPFVRGPHWNLTEQAKLYKTNRAEYDRLKAEAKR